MTVSSPTRVSRWRIDAVIDTNVFVAALTGGRLTGRIWAALRRGACTPVFSFALLDELLFTLARPAFALTTDDVERVKTFLWLHARFVQPARPLHICRDPQDNKVLECALAADADCLVTGDHDLLVLHPFRGIPIVTPRTFLTRFLHETV